MAVKKVLFAALMCAMLTLMGCGSDYLDWNLARTNPNDNPGTISTSGTGGTLTSIKNDLNQIQFVNNNIAYAVGNGIVLKSINGGLNWARINSSSIINFTTLYFANASLGYLGGNDQYYSYIFRTKDGGLTWQQVNRYWFQNERNAVTRIFASNTGQRVVALINQYPNATQVYGHMMYSSNSGDPDTWASVQSNRRAGFNTADFINEDIFIGGNAYWAGTTYRTSVFKTTFLSNGSLALTEFITFQAVNNPSSFTQLDMAGDFLNSGNRLGYATTDKNQLVRSLNSGVSWSLWSNLGNSLIPAASLNAILFTSDAVGFIGTSSGVIFKTEDSGLTWSTAFQVANEVLDLALRPDGKVFAVGKNGLVTQIN